MQSQHTLKPAVPTSQIHQEMGPALAIATHSLEQGDDRLKQFKGCAQGPGEGFFRVVLSQVSSAEVDDVLSPLVSLVSISWLEGNTPGRVKSP